MNGFSWIRAHWGNRKLPELRRPTNKEFDAAIAGVKRMEVVDVLEEATRGRPGPKPWLPMRAWFVLATLTATMQPSPLMRLTNIAAQLKALTRHQRAILGISVPVTFDKIVYDHVDKVFVAIIELLKAEGVDWDFSQIARCGIPRDWADIPAARAIDGTDFETCGAFKHAREEIELDGDSETLPSTDELADGDRLHARVLGYGPDGRKVYTPDTDAPPGYRTATNSRPGGPYIGHELHLSVAVPEVAWTDFATKIRFSENAQPFVMSFHLDPAGTHRGEAVLACIDSEMRAGLRILDVVVDRGISQCSYERWRRELNIRGISQTIVLKTGQRTITRVNEDVVIIDGTFYSSHLPTPLRGVAKSGKIKPFPWPSRNATATERAALQEPFNARARFRLPMHATWDPERQTARFKCPFCAGIIWAPKNSKAPRPNSPDTPMAALQPGRNECCERMTYTLTLEANPQWQHIPYGTKAHYESYQRRQAVERVNSALKNHGGFDRRDMRVFGTIKRGLLTAFRLFAYNLGVAEQARRLEAMRTIDDGTPTGEDIEVDDVGTSVNDHTRADDIDDPPDRHPQ